MSNYIFAALKEQQEQINLLTEIVTLLHEQIVAINDRLTQAEGTPNDEE